MGVGEQPTPPAEIARDRVGVAAQIEARQSAMAHIEGLFLWAGDTLLPYGDGLR